LLLLLVGPWSLLLLLLVGPWSLLLLLLVGPWSLLLLVFTAPPPPPPPPVDDLWLSLELVLELLDEELELRLELVSLSLLLLLLLLLLLVFSLFSELDEVGEAPPPPLRLELELLVRCVDVGRSLSLLLSLLPPRCVVRVGLGSLFRLLLRELVDESWSPRDVLLSSVEELESLPEEVGAGERECESSELVDEEETL